MQWPVPWPVWNAIDSHHALLLYWVIFNAVLNWRGFETKRADVCLTWYVLHFRVRAFVLVIKLHFLDARVFTANFCPGYRGIHLVSHKPKSECPCHPRGGGSEGFKWLVHYETSFWPKIAAVARSQGEGESMNTICMYILNSSKTVNWTSKLSKSTLKRCFEKLHEILNCRLTRSNDEGKLAWAHLFDRIIKLGIC